MSKFCTAVNCMDGRVQIPVIRYLQERFGAEYVDTITEPGPNRILAEADDSEMVQSILRRVHISVEKHASLGIAVVGHYDCAGNPAPEEVQKMHLQKAVERLRKHFAQPVIGLWVDASWRVHEIEVGNKR
jgi:carbonic anhydrase